jgi:hypothetical protein
MHEFEVAQYSKRAICLKYSVVGSDIESIKFLLCIWTVPSLSQNFHSISYDGRLLSNLPNIDGYRNESFGCYRPKP